MTDKKDDRTEWTGVDSDIKLRNKQDGTTGAERLAKPEYFREGIHGRDGLTGSNGRATEEGPSHKRIQDLLKANTEELERRRMAENKLENERVVRDALICQIRRQAKHRSRELVIGFMAGFFLAYALVEGLRWLLS